VADTRYLKSIVEDCVRAWLEVKFGQPFRPQFLPLIGVQGKSRLHEFDAVSKDDSIVCGVKTASWKTSGNKRGSGKVQGAYTELYFLNLVQAKQKCLILTDPQFYRCFQRETDGRLVMGVTLLHCPLPAELCTEIAKIRKTSRCELGFEDLIE
jgi:hypothetical protein